MLVIFTFGGFSVGEYGNPLRSYWWVFILMGLPIVLMISGVDWMWLIITLFVVLIGGGLFLFWFEHGFELPKGDPIKKGFKWMKENFRW